MLPKANRIVSAEDFRRVTRKGKSLATANKDMIVSIVASGTAPSRYGFVVTKASGDAVTRNSIKRKLRVFAAAHLAEYPTGYEVVVRVLRKPENVADVVAKFPPLSSKKKPQPVIEGVTRCKHKERESRVIKNGCVVTHGGDFCLDCGMKLN